MAVPIIYFEKHVLNNINTIQNDVLIADDNKEFLYLSTKINQIIFYHSLSHTESTLFERAKEHFFHLNLTTLHKKYNYFYKNKQFFS